MTDDFEQTLRDMLRPRNDEERRRRLLALIATKIVYEEALRFIMTYPNGVGDRHPSAVARKVLEENETRQEV